MLAHMTPRDAVAALEAQPAVPKGDGDRFAGYGVTGVTFPSGDVLALRRLPASSIGPGYGSVWHRDREGQWTFYQDVSADQGCARYFRPLVGRLVLARVRVVWTGAQGFSVLVDQGRTVEWAVELGESVLTHVLTRLASAGRLRFARCTPSGHTFVAQPSSVWRVAASRAVIGGRDTGEALSPREPIRLGSFGVPRDALFAVGRAHVAGFPDGRRLSR